MDFTQQEESQTDAEGRGRRVLKTYFTEIVTAVLSLIILALVFILLDGKVEIKEYIDFKTIFSSVATFGGAAIGALLAGKYTLKSVKEQIDYDSKKVSKKEDLNQQKYNLLLSSHLNIIRNNANNIIFMKDLYLNSSHSYNINPLHELETSIAKIKDIVQILLNIDFEYISVDNYKLLGIINDKIYEIENAYKGFQATEEEESLGLINKMEFITNDLLRIIDGK